MAQRKSLTDEIREAIDASPYTRGDICRLARIDKAAMSRFMARKKGLRLATIDRLAEVLGLHVVARPPRRAKRKRR